MLPIGKPAAHLVVALMILLSLDGVGVIEIEKVNDEIRLESNQRRDDNSIEQIEHVVKFKNTSGQDIVIKNIDSDEHVCEAIGWKRQVIRPGEKGFIRLKQKNILGNDGDESVIRLDVVFGLENGSDKTLEFEIKRKVKELS